jgi:hypothetical protein
MPLHYAECHFAKCHFVGCRGAEVVQTIFTQFLQMFNQYYLHATLKNFDEEKEMV